eukprot:8194436-Pyramimonas_sp.AAC.1
MVVTMIYMCRVRRQVLRYGDTFSANQRVTMSGRDTFVRLDDDTGWLFETKRGVACLRRLPVEYGLWVYRVIRTPNVPLLCRPDPNAPLPLMKTHLQEAVVMGGELVAANARVVTGFAHIEAGINSFMSCPFPRCSHRIITRG